MSITIKAFSLCFREFLIAQNALDFCKAFLDDKGLTRLVPKSHSKLSDAFLRIIASPARDARFSNI